MSVLPQTRIITDSIGNLLGHQNSTDGSISVKIMRLNYTMQFHEMLTLLRDPWQRLGCPVPLHLQNFPMHALFPCLYITSA